MMVNASFISVHTERLKVTKLTIQNQDLMSIIKDMQQRLDKLEGKESKLPIAQEVSTTSKEEDVPTAEIVKAVLQP